LYEETFTRGYLLESIEVNEKALNRKVDQDLLLSLLKLNLDPEPATDSNGTEAADEQKLTEEQEA